jgi:hypothetical protein
MKATLDPPGTGRRSLPAPSPIRLHQTTSDEAVIAPNAAKVLIIYDNFEACERGRDAVMHLLLDTGGTAELRNRFWRFDALEGAVARICAMLDAIDADFVVVAPSPSHELPGKIARWLKTCLYAKRGGGTIVAALHPYTPREGGDDDVVHFLRDLAGHADMAFVLSDTPRRGMPAPETFPA